MYLIFKVRKLSNGHLPRISFCPELCEEKMKLTNEMRAEVETIQTRFNQINDEFVVPVQREIMRVGSVFVETIEIGNAIIGELNIYKVRLENILCDTDIKEQDHL